ncbi:MAG TPA: hypothetical protein VHV31_13435 [Nitrolancea sp.]|nr:hypothetical protein [Nitrolancea sp.]
MSDSHPDERDTVVDARFRTLAVKYGERFDAAAEAKIRNDIGKLVDAAETLRKLPLANGDEPDFAFQPVRRDG